jgi:hypothetical protein
MARTPRQRAASAFSEALEGHPDLPADLRQCRAVLPDDIFAVLAHGEEEPDARNTLAYQEADARRAACLGWLRARYARLWASAPVRAPSVDFVLTEAIRTGSWARAFEGARVAETLVIARGSAPAHAYAAVVTGDQVWTERERGSILWPPPSSFTTITLHLAPGADERTAVAALKRALRARERALGRATGTRGPGNLPALADDIALYRLWREHPTRSSPRPDLVGDRPTITWPDFASRARESGQFPRWRYDTDENTVKTAARKAIRRVAPDPRVPATLAAYLAAQQP